MHKSVLKKEVVKYLSPQANENFIDATAGEGGHSLSILDRNKPKGRVVAIEISPGLYKKLEGFKEKRLIAVNDSYTNLKKIVKKIGLQPLSGILFDLGLSSWHLEESKRGFSFLKDEILDMRYNPQLNELTSAEIVNDWSREEIEEVLKLYGEEKFSKRIAQKVVDKRKQRPFKKTFQLVEAIREAVPSFYRHRKIHPATRTFQALRIAVNNELNNIEEVLPQALDILEEGGRMVIVSFQSLEDRIIKRFFKKQSKRGYLKVLTKKPITPSIEEIAQNPSSRSAKLRAGIKITK